MTAAAGRERGIMANESVVYRIDVHDKITSANREWDRFAIDNSSEHLVFERIASRSLWDFISDATTQLLYRDILERVRSGHRLSFPLRCDSADRRRFLEMHMQLVDHGAVEFEVRTLSLEIRPPQELLESGGRRTKAFLRMCSWCKRIPDGNDWIEIEEAVAKMRLFEADSLPMISHGMCEQCELKMHRSLDR